MLNTFWISHRLKNTYRVNGIIYSIKQLPLIGKILPNKLYQSKALKIIGNIISILIEIGSIFLGKLLYVLFVILAMLDMMKANPSSSFVHIFVFLTIAGAFLNTYMFNPTKDKYYAMILMKMDAKKYTLSDYGYALLKVIVGFLPFTILFGRSVQVPLWICLMLPLFVVCVKATVSAYTLKRYEKTKKVTNENLPEKQLWIAIGELLVLAYGLPYFGFALSNTIYLILFLSSLLLGGFSLFYIYHFSSYRKIYQELLTTNNNIITQNTTTELLKEQTRKQIELGEGTSNKTGYAYFHELFVKRHRKILTKSAKKTAIISFFILCGVTIVAFVNPTLKAQLNSVILVYLPYMVFIMYMINRGTVVTQAMFINCDHSMLTYRFYRTPKVILGLFRERLKTLIMINLIPALVIGGGLALLLWVTGGTTNPWNYVILVISILAMSIFFSVHYLVMYYLLQPYNIAVEVKSASYKLIQTLTYLVCYYMLQLRLPIFSFGITMILFSIAYSFISLFLVYRYAPKTFKIRP